MAIIRNSSQFNSLGISGGQATISSYDPAYPGSGVKGRIVFVCVRSYVTSIPVAIVSATYGGVPMRPAAGAVINNFVMSYNILFIINPPAGAQNIVLRTVAYPSGTGGVHVTTVSYYSDSDYSFRLGGTELSPGVSANTIYAESKVTTKYENSWSIALTSCASSQNILEGTYVNGNGNPSVFEVVDSDGLVSLGTKTGVAVSNGTVSDVNPANNYNSTFSDLRSDSIQQVGVCFYNQSSLTLTSASVYLGKSGLPTGTFTAKIYAMTGTYGVDGKPTGTVLATSDSKTIGTGVPAGISNQTYTNFVFSGANQITLTSTTHYCLVIDCNSVTGDSSKYLTIGQSDFSDHDGNSFSSTDSSTYSILPDNLIFVIGNGTATTFYQKSVTFLPITRGTFLLNLI